MNPLVGFLLLRSIYTKAPDKQINKTWGKLLHLPGCYSECATSNRVVHVMKLISNPMLKYLLCCIFYACAIDQKCDKNTPKTHPVFWPRFELTYLSTVEITKNFSARYCNLF